MPADIVRVLRTIEYIGPRADVAKQIAGSVHGERRGVGNCVIHAATVSSELGDVPTPEETHLVDTTVLQDRLNVIRTRLEGVRRSVSGVIGDTINKYTFLDVIDAILVDCDY